MRTGKMKWAGKAAAAGVLALSMAAPAVQAQTFNDQHRGDGNLNQGDSRDQRDGRGGDHGQYDQRDNRDGRGQRADRENQRVSIEGRVTSFSHERNGYRVRLDRGGDYWVPESYFRGRGHNLRVGIQIVLGGVFRGGSINVDAVNWPDNGGYDRGYDRGFIAGTVERVDYRDGTMLLRDERSGRMITAATGGYGRRSLDGIRRGDYVELSGGWDRGVFDVARIDNVRGRY